MAGSVKETTDVKQVPSCHSDDMDVDHEIRRMSQHAFSILDSITDEVAEISKQSSSRALKQSSSRSLKVSRHRSISPSPDEDDDDHKESEQQKKLVPSPNKSEKSMEAMNGSVTTSPAVAVISPLNSPKKRVYTAEKEVHEVVEKRDDVDYDEDDDTDDMSDDGDISDDESIMKELSALRAVTQEIEKELKAQDAESMYNAIARIEASPKDAHLKRLLGSDDEEIIRRILDEEMKKEQMMKKKQMLSAPKTKVEESLQAATKFFHENHLYGPGVGEQELNVPLLAGAIFVWAVVVRLTWSVMYGDVYDL